MMLTGRRIVVVEDDGIMGASLVQRLELEGARVTWLRLVARALGELRTPRHPIDAVVCDIRLPDGSGEELYRTLCQTTKPPPFLFITGQSGVEQAVRLMQSGAADYLTKPFDMAQFLARLHQILPPPNLTAHALNTRFGVSDIARRIETQIAKAAASQDHVLIRGPSGTGKRFIALGIHRSSDRALGAFAEVKAARSIDITADLRSAFKIVGNGTIFIDALERLDGPSQSLLSDLADRQSDVRIIAAAAANINQLVSQHAIRQDLFYRLARIEIVLSPLSDRLQDAVWLAQDLFKQMNASRIPALRGISALAEEAIKAHTWPGNGRELRSRLVRAMDSASAGWIQPLDLFPERSVETQFVSLAEARDAAERSHILMALDKTHGQVTEAAKLLAVSRTTLWEKMQKLGL